MNGASATQCAAAADPLAVICRRKIRSFISLKKYNSYTSDPARLCLYIRSTEVFFFLLKSLHGLLIFVVVVAPPKKNPHRNMYGASSSDLSGICVAVLQVG